MICAAKKSAQKSDTRGFPYLVLALTIWSLSAAFATVAAAPEVGRPEPRREYGKESDGIYHESVLSRLQRMHAAEEDQRFLSRLSRSGSAGKQIVVELSALKLPQLLSPFDIHSETDRDLLLALAGKPSAAADVVPLLSWFATKRKMPFWYQDLQTQLGLTPSITPQFSWALRTRFIRAYARRLLMGPEPRWRRADDVTRFRNVRHADDVTRFANGLAAEHMLERLIYIWNSAASYWNADQRKSTQEAYIHGIALFLMEDWKGPLPTWERVLSDYEGLMKAGCL